MQKLNYFEVDDVLRLTNDLMRKYPDYRYGQAFYNALHELFPNVALYVNGTEYDTFNNDMKVVSCIEYISSDNK